jgi:hypothetical protein
MCERWHALPEPGGLLDQPAGLMERMTAALNVVNTLRARNASENWAQWMNDNPDAARLINEVEKLRSEHGE